MTTDYKQIGFKAFAVSFMFTTYDYIAHLMFKSLKIVSYPYNIIVDSPLVNYAIVKLITTFIIIFVVLWLIHLIGLDFGLHFENVITLLIVVFALQFRYTTIHGYSSDFNTLNFINHIITFGLSLFTFWYFEGDDN